MLVSDHPHLFEVGGENYHTDFSAWELRARSRRRPVAHASRPDVDRNARAPGRSRAFVHHAYDDSRTWFRAEEDFPGPRTMRAAEEWLRTSARHHDRFLLFVDEFDPHEPFDTPAPWATRYDADVGRSAADLAAVLDRDHRRRVGCNRREARQIRANYQSKLTMIDHWLGRILDAARRRSSCGTTPRSCCAPTTATTSASATRSASRASRCTRDLGHTPLLDRVAGRRARARSTRSRRTSTCTRRSPTSSASRPRTARTADRSCR